MGDNRRVTLNLDTSTPIRSLARYRELVTAVFEAPVSAQETVAMEWKREANVGDKPWQAELSRQVLGFANRDPDVAAIWFGGCAYILVGVSPGILNGTPVREVGSDPPRTSLAFTRRFSQRDVTRSRPFRSQ